MYVSVGHLDYNFIFSNPFVLVGKQPLFGTNPYLSVMVFIQASDVQIFGVAITYTVESFSLCVVISYSVFIQSRPYPLLFVFQNNIDMGLWICIDI